MTCYGCGDDFNIVEMEFIDGGYLCNNCCDI